MDRIVVVANAAAGSSDEDAVSEVVGVLKEHAEVDVVSGSDPDDVATLVVEGVDAVVVAGGDGSLHMCVEALHRRDVLTDAVIGLVPLGTGNDFARTVELPLGDASAAARAFLGGVPRPVDLLVDEDGGVVVNAVHLGVGAEAGRQAEPLKPRLGRVGYAVGALLAGLRSDGERIRVVADERVLADGRRRVLQVAVGNGRYVGGGTPLVPDADPHDGRADVVVSFAVGPLDRLRYAVRLRRGAHDRDDDVATVRASAVTIEGSGLAINADGELLAPVARRRWQVEPGAMTMMLPPVSLPEPPLRLRPQTPR